MDEVEGFILTRDWRDSADGLLFEIWITSDQGPIRLTFTQREAVYFVDREAPVQGPGRRVPREMKTLNSLPVDAVYCDSRRAWSSSRNAYGAANELLYESEINPMDRFLMERFIRGDVHVAGELIRDTHGTWTMKNATITRGEHTPELKVASLDIETEDLEGALYSIAIAMDGEERVFMVGASDEVANDDLIEACATEAEAIKGFLQWIRHHDPDVLIGWNVIDFDLAFLDRKCKEHRLSFDLGRNDGKLRIIPPQEKSRRGTLAKMAGRVVIDGIEMLRSATWNFERFGLEYVAQELLGRGKAIESPEDRLGEIRRMFREDKAALAKYNLEDCRLVLEIFEHTNLMGFAVERARLMGLPIDRHGGSVASFDFRYLPLLHREGYVAPDVGSVDEPVGSAGGYVMDSQPGLFENVLLLDFKSLYPTIIRTFKIDPLGAAFPGERPIPGFKGGEFSRERHILPELIAELMAARQDAKEHKNAPLSQAIKIMMNSFYGVLGTPGCRFFHPKLASSITERGHELLQGTRDFIEAKGYGVIYGDTDSVFVLVGPDHDEEECKRLGDSLAKELNDWWRVTLRKEFDLESFLELEFEQHYLRFVMPTVRGSVKGTKKRYAGLTRAADGGVEVEFKGLEAVRTDWTPLARRFQRELYRRVFLDEPYLEWVAETATKLMAGEFDDELEYRKRLRKDVEEYVKNVPPHVQAARKLDSPGRWVSYVITVNGPEPVEARRSALDYHHYLERQLAPAADSILQFKQTSFEEITQRQLEMFSREEWGRE